MIASAAPVGGVFIPHNGGYVGRMGKAQVFFDQRNGGTLSLVTGERPRFKPVAKLDMVFALKVKGQAEPVEVRQSFDRSPQVWFLEEGNDRTGLRVLFKMYDTDGVYHGHGMNETWLYPDGQIFVTTGAMFENPAAHEGVTSARLDVQFPVKVKAQALGSGGMADFNDGAMPLKMNDSALPGRTILFSPQSGGSSPVALYWKSGRMEHNTFIYRGAFGEKGAPTYFRWPDYFRQAYGIGAYADKLTPAATGVQLDFPVDPAKPNPMASFNSLFRLAVVSDANAAKALVESERDPVKMTVTGGVIHGTADPKTTGYNDQEGCYELRKNANPMTVTLPADPQGRTIRVKTIGLTGHGAVVTTLDGKALVPMLTTDGGIADDPLAPIREQPEAPADAAMVTVKLADKPQTLVVSEQAGIQLVYQTRDSWRNYAIYSSKTGPRWSGLRFSLVDGHARNMRGYGKQNWALSENLLHWFSYCGYTPEQMLDQLRDFEVVKNGPDEIVYKYTSSNQNDGAQSVYVVSARADSPAMQIHVAANFTVLDRWPYESSQFFDVFPFRGVWTKDWWYKNVLWLTPDGRWKTMDTVQQTYEGDKDLARIVGAGFFGLYSSDNGNMLMLTKNFKPANPTEYVICGNYIDYHMDVKFIGNDNKPMQPQKGYQQSVEYDLAIYGDKSLTRDKLIDIGKKSIQAGKLVIPSS